MNSKRPIPRNIIIKHSKEKERISWKQQERSKSLHTSIVNKIINIFLIRKFRGQKRAVDIFKVLEKSTTVNHKFYIDKTVLKSEEETKAFLDK